MWSVIPVIHTPLKLAWERPASREVGVGCDHTVSPPTGWLKAVQVLMVLSLILCCLSFILFMFQLYTMRRGGLFYATGLCQLCTSKHFPEIRGWESTSPGPPPRTASVTPVLRGATEALGL